ncbi:hypothetical protein HaLaN_18155 [Haematococcus lacustris]|uniref:Uncharacterized protein n=1 Tax=Haematococcus lacustris TaxID=44745 RepID=A0A699ZPZ3_HAELA|nr:hypothetical protein HaLaN_18155 [Haematococcus lacustris]
MTQGIQPAISVQPGESLLLQGQPSDASSAAVKASQWQLGSAGSQLAVSDLGLLDVELAPSGSDSKLNLPPLNQQCRLQLADSSGSSPQVGPAARAGQQQAGLCEEAEVEADWLMIWRLAQPGLQLDSCALTCQRVGSVHEVQRALLELQPLCGQVVLQVVRNISLASAPLSADNSSQAAGEQWPSPGRALRVYRNVTLLGRQDVELDFYLHRFMLYMDNTSAAVLQLANLVLAPHRPTATQAHIPAWLPSAAPEVSAAAGLLQANVPTGPRRAFPATVLLAMLWPIAMDRSPSARVSVRVVNCTLVVPDDTFAYTSYW